jgi:catalase
VSGDVARYNTEDDDNVTQVQTFWKKVLGPAERTAMVENIAGHLKNAQEFIQKRQVRNFSQVDSEFGSRVQAALDKFNEGKGSNL